MSFCFFPVSAGYPDGKHIERAGRGMQPGFGNMQVPGRSLCDRHGRAGALNAARIDASIDRSACQTNGAAGWLITVS